MVVVHYIEAIIFYTFENEFWMDGWISCEEER